MPIFNEEQRAELAGMVEWNPEAYTLQSVVNRAADATLTALYGTRGSSGFPGGKMAYATAKAKVGRALMHNKAFVAAVEELHGDAKKSR